MSWNARVITAVLSLTGAAELDLLVVAHHGALAQQPGAMTWPGGHHAAIVLTYDDALRSQLDNAVPALDAAGLKGTFFLTGTFNQEDVDRWRAVAREGHELGNHSVFHPCARGSFDMPEQQTTERYSVPWMLKEIGAMNTMLSAIDGRKDHTYATPCGQHMVGGEDYLPALRTSGLTRYVRAASDSGAAQIDPFDVPSTFFPEGVTGAQLIEYVDKVRAKGGLGVMGFHGVGGDYLTVSAEAHKTLVQYLHDHKDEIWVAPFNEVMDHVTAHLASH
jgi:peptidoglycan/xylan/chitin deacetylase (PgdA/CDA1 family)